MHLNPRQRGSIYEWALMADGKPVQLFISQSEALKAWRDLRKKRRNSVTELSVQKLIGLFDA